MNDKRTFEEDEDGATSFEVNVRKCEALNFQLQKMRESLKQKKKVQIFARKSNEEKQLSLQAFELEICSMFPENDIDNLVIRMMKEIPTGKKYGSFRKSFDNCYSGKNICLWLEQVMDLPEDEAIQIGQTLLMNRGILYSVSKSHISFHKLSDVFYRLHLLDPWTVEGEHVLNECKYYLEDVTDTVAMSTDLASELFSIMRSYSTDGQVDFDSLRECEEIKRFTLKTTQLQKADFDSITSLQKQIFLINVYNTLLMHSYICFGPPRTLIEKKVLMGKRYRIGGNYFTLEALMYILRGRGKDLREPPPKALLDLKKNPFVHFCLFNGSNDTPLLRAYQATDFESKSKVSEFSTEFIERTVKINQDRDEVWLPKLFRDYFNDFGENDKQILEQVSQFFPSQQEYIRRNLQTIDVKFKENSYNDVPYFQA